MDMEEMISVLKISSNGRLDAKLWVFQLSFIYFLTTKGLARNGINHCVVYRSLMNTNKVSNES